MKISLGRHVLLELHQQTLLADADVERIKRLHLAQVARRRHSSHKAATCRDRQTCVAGRRTEAAAGRARGGSDRGDDLISKLRLP